MKKNYLMLICIFIFQGCSGVKIIPTVVDKNGKGIVYPAIPVSEVKIYRNTKIEGKEIGIITVSGENPEVEKIYETIREEAAKAGAQFVTDFKLKVQEESNMQSTQNCSGGSMGQAQSCTTSTTMITKQVFNASGTLLRK